MPSSRQSEKTCTTNIYILTMTKTSTTSNLLFDGVDRQMHSLMRWSTDASFSVRFDATTATCTFVASSERLAPNLCIVMLGWQCSGIGQSKHISDSWHDVFHAVLARVLTASPCVKVYRVYQPPRWWQPNYISSEIFHISDMFFNSHYAIFVDEREREKFPVPSFISLFVVEFDVSMVGNLAMSRETTN